MLTMWGGLDFDVTSASTGIGERPGTRMRRPSSFEPQPPAGLSPGVREYLRCPVGGQKSLTMRFAGARWGCSRRTLAYLTEKSSTLSPRHLNERKTSDGEPASGRKRKRDGESKQHRRAASKSHIEVWLAAVACESPPKRLFLASFFKIFFKTFLH